MSVVVAIKKDGKIIMGADSQVTSGGTRVSLSNPNNYKIWKVKGVDNCLMGHVGNLRDACVTRTITNFVREIDVLHNTIDFEYVVDRVVPMLLDLLKDRKYLKDENLSTMESRFLFAYKDKLFVIGTDTSVIEVDDCVAIGSGESEAIGSLLTSQDTDDARLRVIKAIRSSAAHDIYVDYPIILSDTENTKFEVLKEDDLREMKII